VTQTIATPNPTASLAPASVEQSLAEVLAEVVGAEQVSPDAPFLEDLGADSMALARFCARVRMWSVPHLRFWVVRWSEKARWRSSRGRRSHSSPGRCVDFVLAAQRTCNTHSDFCFKGST
jgi:Phosphopantetheine attachment site